MQNVFKVKTFDSSIKYFQLLNWSGIYVFPHNFRLFFSTRSNCFFVDCKISAIESNHFINCYCLLVSILCFSISNSALKYNIAKIRYFGSKKIVLIIFVTFIMEEILKATIKFMQKVQSIFIFNCLTAGEISKIPIHLLIMQLSTPDFFKRFDFKLIA